MKKLHQRIDELLDGEVIFKCFDCDDGCMKDTDIPCDSCKGSKQMQNRVGLAMVLRAWKNNEARKGDGKTFRFLSLDAALGYLVEVKGWDLTKDLDGQSQELKEWLYNLIK